MKNPSKNNTSGNVKFGKLVRISHYAGDYKQGDILFDGKYVGQVESSYAQTYLTGPYLLTNYSATIEVGEKDVSRTFWKSDFGGCARKTHAAVKAWVREMLAPKKEETVETERKDISPTGRTTSLKPNTQAVPVRTEAGKKVQKAIGSEVAEWASSLAASEQELAGTMFFASSAVGKNAPAIEQDGPVLPAAAPSRKRRGAKRITTLYYVCYAFEAYDETVDPMKDLQTKHVAGAFTNRKSAERETSMRPPQWMQKEATAAYGAIFAAVVESEQSTGKAFDTVLWTDKVWMYDPEGKV